MLPDAKGFTIEGSNLTEVNGGTVDISSTIVYNVYFAAEDKAGVGVGAQSQMMDKEKWKEMISKVDDLIAKRQSGEEDEVETEDTSDDADTNKEQPTIMKRLIVYTGVDVAKKRLKTTVEIIFTLTPAGSPSGGGQWPTIVWKTLKFQPNNAIRHELSWYNKAGFCVVDEQNDTTLKPGDMSAIVESKHLAILQDIDESPDFSSHTEITLETTDIAVLNKLPSSQRFALCTIDPTMPETDQFLPVIDIGSVKSDDILLCGIPVMLQAYVVRGFTVRKPIDTSSLLRPLFVDKAGKPKPLDIMTLRPSTAFRLYSNPAGRIILEND